MLREHIQTTNENWQTDILSWYQAHPSGLFAATISAGWEGCLFGWKYNNSFGGFSLVTYSLDKVGIGIINEGSLSIKHYGFVD